MDVSQVPFDPHVNPPSAKLLFPVQPAVPLLGSRGFVLSFTMQKCEVFAVARRNGVGGLYDTRGQRTLNNTY